MLDSIRIRDFLRLCMIVCIVGPVCRAQTVIVRGTAVGAKGNPVPGTQVLLLAKGVPPRRTSANTKNGIYVFDRVTQKIFTIVACAGKDYIPGVAEDVTIKDGESSKIVPLTLVFANEPDNRQTLSGIVKDKTIQTVYAWAYECQLDKTSVNQQGRWEFVKMPKPPDKFAYEVRTKDGKLLKSNAIALAEKKEVVLRLAVNSNGVPTGLTAELASTITVDASRQGVLAGRVYDPNEAVILNARVYIKNRETNATTEVATNDSGDFQVSVPMGIYDIVVGGQGFLDSQIDNILVAGNDSTRLDVPLEINVNAAASQVSIDYKEPLIRSQPNSTVIDERPIVELPLNARNLVNLMTLSPQVTTRSDDSRHAGQYSVNGSSPNSTTFILDSAELKRDDVLGPARAAAPEVPFDAIAETNVSLHEQAELGRSSGGTVVVLTKSGTDRVNGSAFYWNRNSTLAARDFFERDKSHFLTHHFGFTIGGPIVKSKLFYFGSYEGKREQQARPRLLSVPSPAVLASARSVLSANGLSENALSTRLLTFFPAPDRDGIFHNRSLNSPVDNNADNFIVRLDNASNKRGVSLIYNFARTDQFYPVPPSFIPGFRTDLSGRTQSLTGKISEIITPRFVNELTIRYDRNRESFRPEDHEFNPLTIGLNSGVTDPQRFGLPLIKIAGFDALGSPFEVPARRVSSSFQVNEFLVFVRGRLRMTAGGDFRRVSAESNNDAGTRGRIVFDGSVLGNPLADFLAGLPSGNTAIVRGDTQRQLEISFANFFVQSEITARPNMMLNFGLRYGFNSSPNEKSNQLSTFIPDAGLVQIGSGQVSKLFEKDLNNLAPRASVAWDPAHSGNFVIRAGWGLYFNSPSLSLFSALCPCPNSANAAVTMNPVGSRPVFALSPSGPIPFGPGIPIFDGPALIDLSAVATNLNNPYVHDFYGGFQWKGPSETVLEVSYSGSRGRNLYRIIDINQPSPGNPDTRDSRRPFFSRLPQFGAINLLTSSGKSNYHGLGVSLKRHISTGLWLNGSYTLSKSINEASHADELSQNSRDIGAERALSAFDQRHRFVFSWIYDLGSSSENKLLKGWQASGILTVASGNPFTPLISFDNSGTATFVDRPNVLAGARVNGSRTQLYTSTAFALPPAGSFGNAGRNSLTGPGLNSLDMKLSKRFSLANDKYFELRAEVFNVFNHPNFRLPNNFVDEPAFGSVVATDSDNGRRRFQIGIRLTF